MQQLVPYIGRRGLHCVRIFYMSAVVEGDGRPLRTGNGLDFVCREGICLFFVCSLPAHVTYRASTKRPCISEAIHSAFFFNLLPH